MEQSIQELTKFTQELIELTKENLALAKENRKLWDEMASQLSFDRNKLDVIDHIQSRLKTIEERQPRLENRLSHAVEKGIVDGINELKKDPKGFKKLLRFLKPKGGDYR